MTTNTKMHIIPTGAMHCDLAWLLLDPTRVMADRTNTSRASTWVEVPTHCVLIEHPEGRLLWEAGVPRDWEARWGEFGLDQYFPVDAATEDMWLDSRLRAFGLEPGDVDYLVISHLHLDHAGNAQLWKDTETKLIVSKAEHDGAFGFEGGNLGGYLKADYDGLAFQTVAEDTELLPGVKLLQTPGHSWGTMSLQVDLADSGTYLFTSDSVYMEESYGPPATGAALVYDTVQWLASVEKIRAIAAETDATLVFGHDANQLGKLMTAPEGFYT